MRPTTEQGSRSSGGRRRRSALTGRFITCMVMGHDDVMTGIGRSARVTCRRCGRVQRVPV